MRGQFHDRVLAYSLNLVQLQHFFTSFWRQGSLVFIILANVSNTDPDPEAKRLGGLLSLISSFLHITKFISLVTLILQIQPSVITTITHAVLANHSTNCQIKCRVGCSVMYVRTHAHKREFRSMCAMNMHVCGRCYDGP